MKRCIDLSSWLLILTCLIACSKNEEEVTHGNNTPEIVISSSDNQNPVFDAKGGMATISFTATADWSADVVNTRAESWLTVTPAGGGAGNKKITISVTTNNTTDERNATIFLKCGKINKPIVITQKQKDALTITSNKYTVLGKGGNIAIEAKSNVSFEVEIKNDWIKKVETRALNITILNFAIAPNETGEKREGEIVLRSGELSETVKIYQEIDDFIVSTKDEFMLSDAGGTVDIEVKSTVDYGIKGLPDWITEVTTRNISTHTLHYIVAANESYDAREAKIIFYDKDNENLADTVTIYQAYQGAIIVARNEYEFNAEGTVLDLKVQSNINFDVTTNAEWIKQVLTRGLQEHLLRFNILYNDDIKAREGVITILSKDKNKSQSIRINQLGKVDYKTLERNALIAIYNATNGDNWTNNENWCTDADINTWYGVKVLDGHVTGLDLYNNRLSGILPKEIGKFKNLNYLQMANNNLSGELPKELYSLSNLYDVYLQDNKIGGSLSEDIRQLTKLRTIILSNNQIEGTLPVGLSYLVELTNFQITKNKFSGKIPSEVMSMPNWNMISKFIEPQLPGYGFTDEATTAMIELGDNMYLHPEGIAVELRYGKNAIVPVEELQEKMKYLYTKFGDHFDFICYVHNLQNPQDLGSGTNAGEFMTINNSGIAGLGETNINHSSLFGSAGRLKGMIVIFSRNAFSVFMHEFSHFYGAMNLGQNSISYTGEVSKDLVHWGVSSVNGVLGGFDLNTLKRNVDNNPEKYKASCAVNNEMFNTATMSNYKFSPLELYAMGLIQKEQVPDIHLYDDVYCTAQDAPWLNGVFYAKKERIITINDIVAKYGERTPNYQDSQKEFRILPLIFTANPINDREWKILKEKLLILEKKGNSGDEQFPTFWEATGGRAVLKVGGLDKLYRK